MHVLGGRPARRRPARLARARRAARHRLEAHVHARSGGSPHGDQRLHGLDAALDEAALGPREVGLRAGGGSGLIASEPPGYLLRAQPALAPRAQRRRVTGGDVRSTSSTRISVARSMERSITSSEGGSRPGRSSRSRSCAALLDLVGTVVDRDRLERRRPVRVERLGAARWRVSKVLAARTRLDHLDRSDFEVRPRRSRSSLWSTSTRSSDRHAAHALRRSRAARGRRRRRDTAGVGLRGVERHRAPARAVSSRWSIGRGSSLRRRGRLAAGPRQRRVPRLPDAAGRFIVSSRRERDGSVAEVVVSGDAAARRGECSRHARERVADRHEGVRHGQPGSIAAAIRTGVTPRRRSPRPAGRVALRGSTTPACEPHARTRTVDAP